VLVVGELTTPVGQRAATWMRGWAAASAPGAGAGSSSSSATVTAMRWGPKAPAIDSMLAPARLPETWLGYTSVRAVAIRPTEWNQLTPLQQTALRTWVAAGGEVLIVDGAPGAIFAGDPRPPAAAADPSATVVPFFFGQVHAVRSDVLAASGLDAVLTGLPEPAHPNAALPANRAMDWGQTAARGFALPIPGVGGVQARTYLVILFVFTILIGPVNYVLLRRRRQQALIVLTVPLISLAFLFLLGGYVVAGEGFNVRSRAATLTLLDQTRQLAVTRGLVSLYAAGTAPSGGLRFPRDTAVFPVVPTGRPFEDLSLDLSDQQAFSGGLLRARTPANFETVQVRTARERLAFGRDGADITVVNGLEATVSRLSYRDGSRVYALAAPLAPGSRAVLRISQGQSDAVTVPDTELLPRFYAATLPRDDAAYVALIDRSPFWSAGVPSADEEGSFHLVLGAVGRVP
jgi:hypothetical protein